MRHIITYLTGVAYPFLMRRQPMFQIVLSLKHIHIWIWWSITNASHEHVSLHRFTPQSASVSLYLQDSLDRLSSSTPNHEEEHNQAKDTIIIDQVNNKEYNSSVAHCSAAFAMVTLNQCVLAMNCVWWDLSGSSDEWLKQCREMQWNHGANGSKFGNV